MGDARLRVLVSLLNCLFLKYRTIQVINQHITCAVKVQCFLQRVPLPSEHVVGVHAIPQVIIERPPERLGAIRGPRLVVKGCGIPKGLN